MALWVFACANCSALRNYRRLKRFNKNIKTAAECKLHSAAVFSASIRKSGKGLEKPNVPNLKAFAV